jgi:hypothetical protein
MTGVAAKPVAAPDLTAAGHAMMRSAITGLNDPLGGRR